MINTPAGNYKRLAWRDNSCFDCKGGRRMRWGGWGTAQALAAQDSSLACSGLGAAGLPTPPFPRSSRPVTWHVVPYRVYRTGKYGEDLSGGYYESGGSGLKLGAISGYTPAFLATSALCFPDGYAKTGLADDIKFKASLSGTTHRSAAPLTQGEGCLGPRDSAARCWRRACAGWKRPGTGVPCKQASHPSPPRPPCAAAHPADVARRCHPRRSSGAPTS
jgi:hypothetical protein